MPARKIAFRIFSDFANELAMESRVPELGGGTAVGRPECGAEVTVAAEAKVQAQRREVVVLSEQIERPRQPQRAKPCQLGPNWSGPRARL